MSTEKPNVLIIDPPETITFKGPFTDVVTSEMKVKNPTDHKVAFKVKTTAPRRYCVRPNSGVLSGKDTAVISVMLQPFDFDPNEKIRHRFMIQSAIMGAEQNNLDEFWQSVPPPELMDTRIRVVLENDTKQEETNRKKVEEPIVQRTAAAPQAAPHTAPQAPLAPSPIKPVSEPQPSQPTTTQVGSNFEENERLQREVTELRAERSRLRNLAMSDTYKSGASSGGQQTGIGLIFKDIKNVILIVVLFIMAFIGGLFSAEAVLPALMPAKN